MLMCTQQKRSRLNDPVLDAKISVKNLENFEVEKLSGILIDHSLQYNCHIDTICKSLRYKLFTVRKIKKFLPLGTR